MPPPYGRKHTLSVCGHHFTAHRCQKMTGGALCLASIIPTVIPKSSPFFPHTSCSELEQGLIHVQLETWQKPTYVKLDVALNTSFILCCFRVGCIFGSVATIGAADLDLAEIYRERDYSHFHTHNVVPIRRPFSCYY